MLDVWVLSTGHDLADARVHRICAALRRAGLSVGVAALGDPRDAPPAAALRAKNRGHPSERLLQALLLPWSVDARALVVVDPELIISGLLWRTVRRRPLVADVHEEYPRLLADRGWAHGARGSAALLVAHAATLAARRADVTAVADAHLPPQRARRRLVVRNLPSLSELPPPTVPDPVPRALYVGDVRRSRGLRAMVDAVGATPPWRLDIVGPVDPADRAWLHTRANLGRVRLHGRQPPTRAWPLASGAWAGLALLDDTPAFRAAVPTKVYEYLGSGLGVVASDLPRVRRLLDESGGGVTVRSASEAADVLRCWHDHPELLARHRQAGHVWAQRHLTCAAPFDQLAAAVVGLLRDGR